MGSNKTRPTVDEIYALLKRTSLPTVLVEGKDDIIFYRSVEHELRKFDVDMLPAGNKNSVLQLREKIKKDPVTAPVMFIVDKDLWVHSSVLMPTDLDDLITTNGYSIENDLFADGELELLLTPAEEVKFRDELTKFVRWYAVSVSRHLRSETSGFRNHPQEILDNADLYSKDLFLKEGEVYPDMLFQEIYSNYSHFLRGKSLFALLLRQLSATKRDVKFGGKQLMAFGASRRGANFERILLAVKMALEKNLDVSIEFRSDCLSSSDGY